MDQRLSFVTLAVPDLDAARRFYLDGLGWEAALDVPDEVVMIKVADTVVLSLWADAGFEAEVGRIGREGGVPPFTLSHNVPTEAEVDQALVAAESAGAHDVRPAFRRDWGGYSGYFCDPAGVQWEVAYNPGPIGQEVLS